MSFIDTLWNWLMLALSPYHSIPNSTFFILGVALLLSLATSLANRFLVDIEKMKSAMKEVSAWKRELDKAKKTGDKQLLAKVMKKQQAIMRVQSKMSWDRMKVSFMFFIPFYLVWIVLGGFYSNISVALSPFRVPYLLGGNPVSPGSIGLVFISWYIICSLASSLPLSRVLGIYPEES